MIIKRSNRYNTGISGVSAQRVKEVLHGAASYSAEAADIASMLSKGNLEALDLTSMESHLAPAFGLESPAAGGAALSAAAFVASIGKAPGEYLRMLSQESKMAGNAPTAQSFGSEWENYYSAESFDNQSLIDNLNLSVGLTYKIARQGPAMDMIYRVIALTPEQGGVDIKVPNLFVQNTLRHATDGSESDFGLRRVIDASIDYTVLNDNSTRLIPTHNSATAAMFVPTSDVTPFVYTDGRRTVTTSALAVSKTINLFGVGQLDSINRVGQADYTEALDRNIGIAQVYLKLGSDVLAWETRGLPYSRFVKTPEQGGRAMKLDFPMTSLVIDGNTKDYAGDDLSATVFETIATQGYRVRLSAVLNGSLDVERGTVNINPGVVEVKSITTSTGETVALTSTEGQAIVNGLAALTITGWWPDAQLTNTNHRHLGLMMNVRDITERFLVKTRAPFFVPFPISEDRDQTVMDQLAFAVGTYINNEAIGTLIEYHSRLMRLTGGVQGDMTSGDFEVNQMVIEGIARHLINPYVVEVDVDLQENAQSTSTLENVLNGQEVLINKLRSIGFDILQKTNYENACRYMDGGEIVKKWKWALVTSRTIERFMTVTGDSRTLGAGMPYQLESDLDARLKDTLYMTLVREGDDIDVLSSGMMLMTPSLVTTITATRDGSPRKEAVVQPRFQHYHLLPILVKVNVSGVTELLEEFIQFKVKADGLVTPVEVDTTP